MTTTESRALCEPWVDARLGRLSSRVVMAPMTRSFAGAENVATAAMAEYYARRARHQVGLVLTESTAVHPVGDGFPNAPRLHTRHQAESWRRVVDAVHDAGSPVFSQLLHCGRISHEDFTDGAQPVSATGRAAEGICRRNGKPYALPRRLEAWEMPSIYEQFVDAAARASAVGFDGVELHLGHGYLADQFFDARVNDRSDDYGGSIANRCRFALQLTESVLSACGAAHVMVRISPSRWMDGLYEWPDVEAMLDYLLPAFDALGLRMLDVSCARADYQQTSGRIVRMVRPTWPHLLIAGASLDPEVAQGEIDAGLLDAVTYGQLLIANADLVERLRDRRPLIPFTNSMLSHLK